MAAEISWFILYVLAVVLIYLNVITFVRAKLGDGAADDRSIKTGALIFALALPVAVLGAVMMLNHHTVGGL